MVRNRVFWTIQEHSYFVYYPIISYLRIKVNRIETIDMIRFRWNNGVGGNTILLSTMVLLYRMITFW